MPIFLKYLFNIGKTDIIHSTLLVTYYRNHANFHDNSPNWQPRFRTRQALNWQSYATQIIIAININYCINYYIIII